MKHRTSALAFGSSIVLTVLACNGTTSVAPIPPPPDAGTTSTEDAGGGDAQSEGGSTHDAAIDAGSCTGTITGFVPPPFAPVVMSSCSADEIESYAVACGPSDDNAACLAWKADTAHATCGACILRQDGKGPLRYYEDGTFASLNEGACLQLAGEPACGAATDATYQCATTACRDCPGGAVTGACYEKVYRGDCKSLVEAQLACEGILTGSPAECIVVNGTFGKRLRKVVTQMCGMQGDAGATDAATD